MRPTRVVTAATAATLAGLAGLHVAWAFGSTFPQPDRYELADRVIGITDLPPRGPTLAVAGLLGGAVVTVAAPRALPGPLRGVAPIALTAVLAARGALGVTGRTGRALRIDTSERFRRLDRRYYGPLCLALAAGVVVGRR